MIIGEQLHTEYKVLKPLVKERGGGGRTQNPSTNSILSNEEFKQYSSTSKLHQQQAIDFCN